MAKKSLQDMTRQSTWEMESTSALTWDEIKISALLRIADAQEIQAQNSKIMAQNIQQLMIERDRFKSKSERLQTDVEALTRSNSALRGVITRNKNKENNG